MGGEVCLSEMEGVRGVEVLLSKNKLSMSRDVHQK